MRSQLPLKISYTTLKHIVHIVHFVHIVQSDLPGNASKGSRNGQVVRIDKRIAKLEEIDVS